MAISDINPEFITADAVSKEAMRQQLTLIKDALTVLDGVRPYRTLSSVTLASPAQSVYVPLPNGYNRYIVEWVDARGVANGVLQCRMSQDGSTFFSTAGDYDGAAMEFSPGGATYSNAGGAQVSLSTPQDAAKPGMIGRLYMPFSRNSMMFECSSYGNDNLRRRKQGFVGTAGSNNLAMQFFIEGGAVNLQTGSSFSVLGVL